MVTFQMNVYGQEFSGCTRLCLLRKFTRKKAGLRQQLGADCGSEYSHLQIEKESTD